MDLINYDELTWQLRGIESMRQYMNAMVDSDSEDQNNQSELAEEVDEDEMPDVEQKQSYILREFTESPVQFLPTYKLKDGQYDAERVPSFCDRVIYKQISPDISAEVVEYKSAGITFSDHLPVVFIGKISVRPFPSKYDFKSMQLKFADIYSVLEPQITLSTQRITLENIQYGFRY